MKIVSLTTNSVHGKQEDLTRELAEASAKYYGSGIAMMSDQEFDRKLEMLRTMEEESGFAYDISPTVKVGANVVSQLKKSRHEQPALSLDKVKYKDREKLISWIGDHPVVCSWKLDGLTIVLTYDNGRLTHAVTRGDGVEGSDVTHNVRYFLGIPDRIAYQGHLVVRGEALMTYKEFQRVNEEAGGIYENPRNLASATIQMLDANESKKREIRFYAFKLVLPEADPNIFLVGKGGNLYDSSQEWFRQMWLQELGFYVVGMNVFDTNGNRLTGSNILDEIEHWKNNLEGLDFPTDGLVITYDDQVYANNLGSTGHHPRGSIALKWTDETKGTTLREIEWSVGKTGHITPVAIFDPVRLGAGSTVSRASLHNLSIMRNLPKTKDFEKHIPIKIGSKIEVYLANMIIPQIASVDNETVDNDVLKDIHVPNRCPICGEPTHIVKNNGVETLHCGNVRCPARVRGSLENTFSKNGLFVKGLGPRQIEDLQNFGLLKEFPVGLFILNQKQKDHLDIAYKVSQLIAHDGWGSKSWENLIAAIDAARKTDLQHFLYSLNIPMLGRDLSSKLSKHWNGDIKKFEEFYLNPDFDELNALDGVGPEKAGNIVDWCKFTKSDAVKDMMFRALIDELEFAAPEVKKDQSLSGKTFVITGSVHVYKNRDEFKASVEARGGKVAGSVSKNTDFLVNNDINSTSGKNAKAKSLGVPIISEEEFIERFGK